MPIIRNEFGYARSSNKPSSENSSEKSAKTSPGTRSIGRKTIFSARVRVGANYSAGSNLASEIRSSLARTSKAYRADSVISGLRVGTDNETGAPLASEGSSATLHQGIPVGSNVTAIKVRAPKAPLPGVPAVLTRGSPLLGNRQVLMSFLETNAFGGGSDQGSSINTNSVPLEDDCNPNVNINFRVDDPPPEPPPPPEDKGGSPREPGEPPPPKVRWNCSPTSGCVRSESGTFTSLVDCESRCQVRYRCDNGDCRPDPNGTHANLSLCLNACRSRFSCIEGTCVATPNGSFDTLLDCVESCFPTPRYSCVDGECVSDPEGSFLSLAECEDVCTSPPPPPKYACVHGACVEDPDGSFLSLEDCITECEEPLIRRTWRISWVGFYNSGALCDGWTRRPLTTPEERATVVSWRRPVIKNDGDTGVLPLPCCTEPCARPRLYITDSSGDEVLVGALGIFDGCCRHLPTWIIEEI